MEFTYVIVFHTKDGRAITRTGTGVFYPTDTRAFRLEDMLWEIAQDYDIRPEEIEVYIKFRGETDGQITSKRIEGSKAEASG